MKEHGLHQSAQPEQQRSEEEDGDAANRPLHSAIAADVGAFHRHILGLQQSVTERGLTPGDFTLLVRASRASRHATASMVRKRPTMAEQKISFDDGAAYELLMGKWSQLVGDVFLDWLSLDWLSLPSGLRWIDVGCGNGAFTQLVVDRSAPAEVQGVDPSSGQLVFARKRSAARLAKFQQGDAMALPFDDDRFDAAVMALAGC